MCSLRQSRSEWGTIICFDLYTLVDLAWAHTHMHTLAHPLCISMSLDTYIHPNTLHMHPPPHAHIPPNALFHSCQHSQHARWCRGCRVCNASHCTLNQTSSQIRRMMNGVIEGGSRVMLHRYGLGVGERERSGE